MTSSKSKKSEEHRHCMAQIEDGHVDDRVGAVPGPDKCKQARNGTRHRAWLGAWPGSLEVGHV